MPLTGLGWVIKNALGIDVSAIDFEGMAQDVKQKAEALVLLAERVDERIARLELQQTRIENLLLEMHHGGGYDDRRILAIGDWHNGAGNRSDDHYSGAGNRTDDAPARSIADTDND